MIAIRKQYEWQEVFGLEPKETRGSDTIFNYWGEKSVNDEFYIHLY
jgi:hypothetical protein